MGNDLRKPEAPNWEEINEIIAPYNRSKHLVDYFDRLKGYVRRGWKEGSLGWTDPLIALYNADHGRLIRDLGKLKKANGDIQEAKKLIFHI